jgi:hypothetical protein
MEFKKVIKLAAYKSEIPHAAPGRRLNKVFIKLAKEMHEKFPSYSLATCLRMIKGKHAENLKKKQENYEIRVFGKKVLP